MCIVCTAHKTKRTKVQPELEETHRKTYKISIKYYEVRALIWPNFQELKKIIRYCKSLVLQERHLA